MKKIFSITIKKTMDTDADTSFIGEYTDTQEEGVIDRNAGEFIEKIKDYEAPSKNREYRFFKPYVGEEKVGTPEYYKYGMQDFERMESLNKGDWYFMGVTAVAEVGISLDGGKTWKLDKLTSGGLWGIESDSGEHIKEEANNQLEDLKAYLKEYGFTKTQIDTAFKTIKESEAY